jgi:hypothetical protein
MIFKHVAHSVRQQGWFSLALESLIVAIGILPLVDGSILGSFIAPASADTSQGIASPGHAIMADEQEPRSVQISADGALAEAEADRVRTLVTSGIARVENYFDAKFTAAFDVQLFSTRQELDAYWGRLWGVPSFESSCWMVASGQEDTLVLLTPGAWDEFACEHDPRNAGHAANLITHELVHVFHDQANSVYAFEGMDPLGWFVEGLAAYVSGQLDTGELAPAIDAIRTNNVPTSLATAWSGKYRYGVCGSIVQFIDRVKGRDTIKQLLAATSETDALNTLGWSEIELLTMWQEWELSENGEDTDQPAAGRNGR